MIELNFFKDFTNRMEFNILDEYLPQYVSEAQRHGDFKKFDTAFKQLPSILPSIVNLNSAEITIGKEEDLSVEELTELREKLKSFMPWRKGPYNLFGIKIDTEWRSDFKWDRLKNNISNLEGKKVLDVGSGNGYHCWRMKGAGAEFVVGIDPYLLSNFQFHVINKYIHSNSVMVIPAKMEEFPQNIRYFDTVFSMGVLYHRKSPFEHLAELKGALKPGGELVLETLVIDGNRDSVLVPENRYAQMRNVWFIPSPLALEAWLKRAGFINIRLVDVTKTTAEEQRKTEWMQWDSLSEFLNKQNPELTTEGYPAPKRAIFICNSPA